MGRICQKKVFQPITYLILCLLLLSCSMGTSFRLNEIKSFKGTLIPELSDEPILIEKVSIDLIKKEERRIPLDLPLSLLNYSESYKVGFGTYFLYTFMVKLKDYQQLLLEGRPLIQFSKRSLEMMELFFIPMPAFLKLLTRLLKR